ncbi:hypothetical protein MKX01_031455 [Papaver californicum]|nr:hypothetical protein MKX01_031455 [Papaver californicum]
MHHRFSDQGIAIMGDNNLPEIGISEYHAAMVRRDKVFHGRALAENDDDDSNLLHYANVSLGTPSLSFLVALDTGTNLLWVPCHVIKTLRQQMHLNTYSMNSSSTSKAVSCKTSLCNLQSECSTPSSQCPYKVEYNDYVNSSGVLVEDVLRMKTNNHKPKDINARITFGCGHVQTGFYLNGKARNGLFGLGIGKTSVPSILSSHGLFADSFSMCFGSDGVGRISFGDKGSLDQEETQLNLHTMYYNISVTQLSVGGNLSDPLDVTAIFYSGSELTHLSDPAYTALCDIFASQILHKRQSSEPDDFYQYCYDVSSNSTEFFVPNVSLIMKGGRRFNSSLNVQIITGYCLGVIKTSAGNFIGNNFMTDQHIVFDREKMVLGWKASNCDTVLLLFSLYFQKVKNCNAIQTFGFETHHRFSDKVRGIMGVDNLPEVGSRAYYAAMAHRDRVFHGRALAENDDDDSKLLTFSNGETASLGSLQYANVSLGAPRLSFLVALDTGTNLLWVPCDCTNCARSVMTSTPGAEITLNIYSSNSSSTSKDVSCNSSLFELKSGCSESSSQCPYHIEYAANISSTGVLVKDVLRSDWFYLGGAARNGLFGLGIGNTSVPSIFSREGLVADSFSMCFGFDWFIISSWNLFYSPRYNISVIQLSVGKNLNNLLDFTAIFYSGAQNTFLDDPVYTALCDSFDSQILHKRSSYLTDPYEYCYDVDTDSAEARIPKGPNVALIMKGGSQFNVYNPMVPITNNGKLTACCLGVVKATNWNFIGNNFVTGHHIVFNREKMVLGWKPSNCTDKIVDPSTQPKTPPSPNSGNGKTPAPMSPRNCFKSKAPESPGNGLNSKAPQSPRNSSNSKAEFSVDKPRNLYLIIFMLFLPILQIV